MKLCKDCKYCRAFIHRGEVDFYHCTLKSPKHDLNPVDGSYLYFNSTAVQCNDERKDSTGLFGLFIDKTRCGVEAKNFEPKNTSYTTKG